MTYYRYTDILIFPWWCRDIVLRPALAGARTIIPSSKHTVLIYLYNSIHFNLDSIQYC